MSTLKETAFVTCVLYGITLLSCAIAYASKVYWPMSIDRAIVPLFGVLIPTLSLGAWFGFVFCLFLRRL